MKRWSFVVVLSLVGAACCSLAARGGVSETGGAATQSLRFVDTIPDKGGAAPAPVVVRNTTDQKVTLDLSWGDSSPLSVVSLDHRLGLLRLNEQNPCDAECGTDEVGIECEDPDDRLHVLKPGESWTFEWDGLLVRDRREPVFDSICHDAFAPPSETYLLTACPVGGGCSAREVTLPATGPVEIDLTVHAVPAATCADADLAPRASAMVLAHMELFAVAADRILSCEGVTPSCWAPDDEPTLTAPAGGCEIQVTTAGDQLDVLVYLPRKGDAPQHSRYLTRLTMPGTHVTCVRYNTPPGAGVLDNCSQAREER